MNKILNHLIGRDVFYRKHSKEKMKNLFNGFQNHRNQNKVEKIKNCRVKSMARFIIFLLQLLICIHL
jgi:hypothetical protein